MQEKVELLKALADETRLRIVLLLLNDKCSVNEIAKKLEKPQPTISLALKVLQQGKVINSKREGKFIYYFVADDKIKKIIEVLELK